jgi:hypothetical protein
MRAFTRTVLLIGCALLAFWHGAVRAQPASYSEVELQAMVAPIALYPDEVLTHILVAATRPADVEEAARSAGVDNPAWNPSVRALVPFPEILQRMAENARWLSDLGNAASRQRSGLMDAVQTLRLRAQSAGSLRSDESQVVEQRGPAIAVVTTGTTFLPWYDAYAVYGSWRPGNRAPYWRPWSPRSGAPNRAQHPRPHRAPDNAATRNGPPSPAAQMQQQMPLATPRGNGEPSPARQMQLRQNGAEPRR